MTYREIQGNHMTYVQLTRYQMTYTELYGPHVHHTICGVHSSQPGEVYIFEELGHFRET